MNTIRIESSIRTQTFISRSESQYIDPEGSRETVALLYICILIPYIQDFQYAKGVLSDLETRMDRKRSDVFAPSPLLQIWIIYIAKEVLAIGYDYYYNCSIMHLSRLRLGQGQACKSRFRFKNVLTSQVHIVHFGTTGSSKILGSLHLVVLIVVLGVQYKLYLIPVVCF